MKRLNKNGVVKIVEYLGSDRFTNISINGLGDLLSGSFMESDVSKLKEAKVIVEHIGSGLHRVYDINEAISNVDSVDSVNVPDEAYDTVKTLMPALSQVFPTRDEINDALNQLKAQMIDPEEMIKNLQSQIEAISKQSRDRDEIG